MREHCSVKDASRDTDCKAIGGWLGKDRTGGQGETGLTARLSARRVGRVSWVKRTSRENDCEAIGGRAG